MNRKGFRNLLLFLFIFAVFTQAYGQPDKSKSKLQFDLSNAQLFFGTILPYSTQNATVHLEVTYPGPPPTITYTQTGNVLWQNAQATVAEIRIRSEYGNNMNVFSIYIPQKNISLSSGGAFLQLTLDDPNPDHFYSLKKAYQSFYVGGTLSVNNTKPGGTYTGYYNVVFNYY